LPYSRQHRHALDPYLLARPQEINAENRAAHHMRSAAWRQGAFHCTYLSTKTVDKSVDGILLERLIRRKFA
jgi:hypothetical protein